jgi:NitT/TauT family transport system substrate-binding protein
VTQHSETGSFFESRKFQDFPTMKDALVAGQLKAAFLNVPLAMQLAISGAPVRIVYLGHRDGTALVVPKDSPHTDFRDLRGAKIAVPSRFSNQHILLHRLARERGMPPDSFTIVEISPPEHPAALATGAVDAYIIGEPFAAKGELDGIGRVLHFTKDIWPGFISCVLVMRTDFMDEEHELAAELIEGIAKSGMWLDEDTDNRYDAAVVVGKHFYLQPPRLLQQVLTRPLDRVTYGTLKPVRENLEEIMELGVSIGIFPRVVPYESYVDERFVPEAERLSWGASANVMNEEARRLRGTFAPGEELPRIAGQSFQHPAGIAADDR